MRQVTPETKFAIDYAWWDESNLDLKTYLYTRLAFGDDLVTDLTVEKVDLVDSRTAEVRQVDAFQYLVQSYYGRHADDVGTQGLLVDAVFSVLLANGNEPMAIEEVALRVNKPVDLLIRTFGGSQVYHGIRPQFDED
jgi:hypothetical protein